jgi:hypothetical protein
MNPVLVYILKAYAGRLSSYIARAVTWGVGEGIGLALAHWPVLAGLGITGADIVGIATGITGLLDQYLIAESNVLAKTNPQLASVAQAIATAKVAELTTGAETTVHPMGEGVSVTVHPAEPPQSEHPI